MPIIAPYPGTAATRARGRDRPAGRDSAPAPPAGARPGGGRVRRRWPARAPSAARACAARAAPGYDSSAPGIAPVSIAPVDAAPRASSCRADGRATPISTSEWPDRYFVDRVHDDVGAEVERAHVERRRERRVDAHHRARLVRRVDEHRQVGTSSSGFVTVSSQSSPAPSSAAITASVSAIGTGRTVMPAEVVLVGEDRHRAGVRRLAGRPRSCRPGCTPTTAAIAAMPLANASAGRPPARRARPRARRGSRSASARE